jgi:hypothetical protein
MPKHTHTHRSRISVALRSPWEALNGTLAVAGLALMLPETFHATAQMVGVGQSLVRSSAELHGAAPAADPAAISRNLAVGMLLVLLAAGIHLLVKVRTERMYLLPQAAMRRRALRSALPRRFVKKATKKTRVKKASAKRRSTTKLHSAKASRSKRTKK